MAISQITAGSIADGTVVASDIADGTITNAKIVSVANTKITGTLGGFDTGTVMLFGQTTAPTGWTKDTTNYNNSSLRVVTGTASSGGSVDFTTAFASQTPTGSVSITSVTGSAGATTLTTPQIPSHTHTINNKGSPGPVYTLPGESGTVGSLTTGATGGDGSHTHPFSFSSGSGTFSGNAINLAVKYVDVIRATKD
jgi:hypothetical protein